MRPAGALRALAVTVAELPDEEDALEPAWAALRQHVAAARSDWVMLPEMPFAPWVFGAPAFDPGVWAAAIRRHDVWMARLAELGAPVVAASRPVEAGGRRLNRAFAWTRDGGICWLRAKHWLPEEPTAHEATWFDRGEPVFDAVPVAGVRVGVQLCTELFFPEGARRIGRTGGQLIVAARASTGHPRWAVAVRMAAIVAGAFVVSANRRSGPTPAFPGTGWIVDPDGEVLATTSAEAPFATALLDLALADRARATYPRNVEPAPGA